MSDLHVPELNDASAGVRLLYELVATPSVSGDERACAEVFVRHARELGYETEIDEATNAVAHRGAPAHRAERHIVLLGHVDTVPGEIPVRIADGVLHGRGSVDAKGPLAAMLIGASRAELPDGVRVTVAGAAGEETAGSPGARHLVGRFRPDACIIGEPSGWDGVTLGYKGRLVARATARRAHGHSAGPERSAGDEVVGWWERVSEYVRAFNEKRSGAFEVLQATIQDMQCACDGLEQVAWIEGGFRLPVGVSPEGVASTVRALGSNQLQVDCSGAEVAHCTTREDPVVCALTGAIRSVGARPRPKLKTGTADFNVVGPAWGCPIAAYGPGDSSLDHTPNERLSLDEFARSVDVMRRCVTDLAESLAAPASATFDAAGAGSRLR